MLMYRGIDPDEVCKACSGLGVISYGNTSTWRRGVGGNMITMDVCNHCWGSGNANRKWPDWRLIQK